MSLSVSHRDSAATPWSQGVQDRYPPAAALEDLRVLSYRDDASFEEVFDGLRAIFGPDEVRAPLKAPDLKSSKIQAQKRGECESGDNLGEGASSGVGR